MDERDMLKSLESSLPSERVDAASWFLLNAQPRHKVALTNALARESVPQVRAVLLSAAHVADSDYRTEPSKADASALSTAESLLDNLASMVRHELEPAIGWIRLAGDAEIEDFQNSQTNAAVEALRQRLSSLIALILNRRAPKYENVSLMNIIYECLPYAAKPEQVMIRGDSEGDDLIYTDKGLLSIILMNALQNCLDAFTDQELGPQTIDIEFSTSAEGFWLTIRNRFVGNSFSVSEVTTSGVTTKLGHKGIGLSMMRAAARKLSYDLNIEGMGGVATLSLRGAKTT